VPNAGSSDGKKQSVEDEAGGGAVQQEVVPLDSGADEAGKGDPVDGQLDASGGGAESDGGHGATACCCWVLTLQPKRC
jgi:hypothetical protein